MSHDALSHRQYVTSNSVQVPPAVDVSSGVESRPGQKDPAKIRRFLALARGLAVPEPATCATVPSPS